MPFFSLVIFILGITTEMVKKAAAKAKGKDDKTSPLTTIDDEVVPPTQVVDHAMEAKEKEAKEKEVKEKEAKEKEVKEKEVKEKEAKEKEAKEKEGKEEKEKEAKGKEAVGTGPSKKGGKGKKTINMMNTDSAGEPGMEIRLEKLRKSQRYVNVLELWTEGQLPQYVLLIHLMHGMHTQHTLTPHHPHHTTHSTPLHPTPPHSTNTTTQPSPPQTTPPFT